RTCQTSTAARQRHHASDSGVDPAAAARSDTLRPSLSLPHSRSGQYFLPDSGPTHTSSGSQGPQDPCAYARSECDLRTRAGDATPRMLGLCDSSLGKPSAPAPHAVGPALQCRSSSYVPGAGSPAIVRIITGTYATPSASAPGISACGVISNLERVASRI